MADTKKLFVQDTLPLVNLHSSAIEDAFMRAIRNRVNISPAQYVIGQLTVFVVHFDIAGRAGGITTQLMVEHREVIESLNGSSNSTLHKLLDSRAVAAGHEMVELILENGAEHLAWDHASRWQRLKWAWRGIIEPHA